MSREKGQVNLYPMEVLEVIPMQRVTIPQTTPAQSQVCTKVGLFWPSFKRKRIFWGMRYSSWSEAECNYRTVQASRFIQSWSALPQSRWTRNRWAASEGPLSRSLIPVKFPCLQVTARLLKGPVIRYKHGEMEIFQPAWRPPMQYQ